MCFYYVKNKLSSIVILVFFHIIELNTIFIEGRDNLELSPLHILNQWSTYPSRSVAPKGIFPLTSIDPINGTLYDAQSFKKLIDITKISEKNSTDNDKLPLIAPVELFCAHLHPIFNCLMRKYSQKYSSVSNNLAIFNDDNLSWYIFKGAHAKVAPGYIITPSINDLNSNTYTHLRSDLRTNIKLDSIIDPSIQTILSLIVNSDKSLVFDENSEFYKLFRPTNTSVGNIGIYFHGNGRYSSGWLLPGTVVYAAVKGLVRQPSVFENLWVREREFSLQLSSSEAWYVDGKHVHFSLGVFSLYILNIIDNEGPNNSRTSKYTLSASPLIPDIKNRSNSISDFLIMEYASGLHLHEVRKRIKSSTAVMYYNMTDDWYGWFNNALFLLYTWLSLISTFSMTGRFLYMHCDLHDNNIIVRSISNQIPSRILFTEMRRLITLDSINIIDFMFSWIPQERGQRNSPGPCSTQFKGCIADTESLNALLVGYMFELNIYPFEPTPIQTSKYREVHMKSIQLAETLSNIPEWRRISNYYVGGAIEWYKQWRRYGTDVTDVSTYSLNEEFEGIMKVCDYLQDVLKSNNISQKEPCISFEAYLRGYSMFSYRIMRVGMCIRKNITSISKNSTIGLKSSHNLRLSTEASISFWDASRLTLFIYWNIATSNLKTCFPPDFIDKEFYNFYLTSGEIITLYPYHCELIINCLNDDNKILENKFNDLGGVSKNIQGFSYIYESPEDTLLLIYNNFMNQKSDETLERQSKNVLSRGSLKNINLETIKKLNGSLGRIINISKTFNDALKTFEIEEFLLDRWIHKLYYGMNFSLSFLLVGLRFLFRVEPTITGQKNLGLQFLISLTKVSRILNEYEQDDTKNYEILYDKSEEQVYEVCMLFINIYTEISFNINEKSPKENCRNKNLVSSKYKKHPDYPALYQYIRQKFYDDDGEERVHFPKHVECQDQGIKTKNKDFIKQGLCDQLIKPLGFINIPIYN
ncbi:hypothetical protein cand_016430 [Cryptosporidium andersoni]|uniref:Protein kinase domain-containing protein n=1 Tax=Cryptosporidium andersoni TaxID=117008 RepID=A0A1J4MVM9_9CRYT|nr:hypothetical protein cand_016430 [Cryptosporidium andersoni]